MNWPANTKNAHGVYRPCEVLRLPRKAGSLTALSLAEIRLAETPEGWRGATAYHLSTGSMMGSARPVTDHCAPHNSRAEAVSAACDCLTREMSKLPDGEAGREASEIIAWADGLCAPVQADLFSMLGEGRAVA